MPSSSNGMQCCATALPVTRYCCPSAWCAAQKPRRPRPAPSEECRRVRFQSQMRGRVRPGSLTTRFLPPVASYPFSNIQLKRLLKRGFQLQMVEPVHRLDLDSAHLAVLQHIERNRVARAPLSPDLAIEIGQAFGLLALDADDHVAPLDARPLRRARRCYAADEQPPTHFVGVNTKPWPRRSDHAARRNPIAENRRDAVGWNEHVTWHLVAPAD